MHCKNCGHPIEVSENYCSNCGAKIIQKRLTVNYLSSEFFESFWSIESNKPVLTFLDLFRKPLDVIGGYIDGLRKRYINPYGYFTIALTLTGLYTFINLNYFPEYLENSGFKANIEDQDISRELTTKLLENINLITFILIPVITLISRLVFLKNRKYNLAEHLITHLYAYSHVNIITAFLVLISFVDERAFRITNFVSLPIYILYYGYVFKKLYQLKFWKVLLKTLLFLLVFGICFLAIIIASVYIYVKYFSEFQID